MRRAIDELAALVGYVINNLNGTTSSSPPTTASCSRRPPPASPRRASWTRSPRGRSSSRSDTSWVATSPTRRALARLDGEDRLGDGDMEFWIPRGANLFHFVGGARFVHGGAMPQEIVVPVVTVKQIKGKSAEETKTKPVASRCLVRTTGSRRTATASS